MSIFSRFKAIYQARANELATSVEDPKASLDYSLVKLEEIRGQMNRSLVEVSAARRRLETQRAALSSAADRHAEQARGAMNLGRDDLARLALERKQEALTRMAEMDTSLNSLDHQIQNLRESQVNLERKIALFQSKKEELKAIYDASKAQVQVREALSGISGDLSDVGNTIQRAEARIREMQSRADAIEGLIAEGILSDSLSRGQDDIDRELSRIGRQQAVDDEMLQLKAEQHRQLEDSADRNAIPRLPSADGGTDAE